MTAACHLIILTQSSLHIHSELWPHYQSAFMPSVAIKPPLVGRSLIFYQGHPLISSDCKYVYLKVPLAAPWGGVVVKALCYWSDGPGIDSQWCHWGFFPWLLTEPCALGSTHPLKMSTRDLSWGKAGRCVWLTTYHPCSAERQENRGP